MNCEENISVGHSTQKEGHRYHGERGLSPPEEGGSLVCVRYTSGFAIGVGYRRDCTEALRRESGTL